MASGCSSSWAMGRPRSRRSSTSMGSTANSCATARCIARPGRLASPRSRSARAMGRARGAGEAPQPRRDVAAHRRRHLCRARCSICAPAQSSRWLTRADWRTRRSPRAQTSTRKARCVRPSVRARSGVSRPTAELSRRTGSSSRPTPMPRAAVAAGQAGADPRALFQFRHPAARARAHGLDPARPRGLLGHAARS